ncbi:Microtubule-nucleating Tub4p (gamma-tubulin) complex component [Microbotryomycetes sp. JL201]|nr:Microtubule-nucleating Tub4p (gamma-tubulin) complex component [Microbotryomycetes sp. JL201]
MARPPSATSNYSQKSDGRRPGSGVAQGSSKMTASASSNIHRQPLASSSSSVHIVGPSYPEPLSTTTASSRRSTDHVRNTADSASKSALHTGLPREGPAFFHPPTGSSNSQPPLHRPTDSAMPDQPSLTRRRASKMPMAKLIAEHRGQRIMTPNVGEGGQSSLLPLVPEQLLLRDVLYILQGVDGQFVKFKKTARRSKRSKQEPADQNDVEQESRHGIELHLEGTGYDITPPTQVLLQTLAEMGGLYRQVQSRIGANDDNVKPLRRNRLGKAAMPTSTGVKPTQSTGAVEQSLYAALKAEMTEYFRLVAILQGQLENDPQDDVSLEQNDDATPSGFGSGLTLRRLLVWTEDVKLRMRMMGALVETAGGNNVGGALLSSIHAHTSNGDPFVREFSSRLLKTVCVPFFGTLSAWIYEGELKDPFNEFFVELNPALDGGERRWNEPGLGEVGEIRGGGAGNGAEGDDQSFSDRQGVKAHELWESKFTFRREMLPSFLEEAFGRKIFSTGKSLNFMKHSCQDAAWVTERNMSDGRHTLEYDNMAGLERSISLAYSSASQRLFDIFFDKFRLMDHLAALKDYLLLGKGDFVEILMENLGPSLDRPANLLYRHNLTGTLETALKGSMADFDYQSDTVRRLDARMLEFNQGEIGWDVFTLEYKVEAPLDTVLDPKSMLGYQRMFRHLWQIKRVEHSLNNVQRRLMTGARTFLRVEDLVDDFHRTRIALQQMLFFVRQLQYYCHLEVIGCSWQSLQDFVDKKQGGLDGLIEAHQTYLERLISKALLLNGRKSSKRDTMPLLDQVRQIFRLMLQYRTAADSLCNHALAEASRQETMRDVGRGIDSPIPSSGFNSNPDELTGIRDRLEEYSTEFRAMSVTLITQLGQAPDLDARFLSVRLNYNYHFVNTSSSKQ